MVVEVEQTDSGRLIIRDLRARDMMPAMCQEAGGSFYNVVATWCDRACRNASFGFCTSRSCAAEDVAADLVPTYIAWNVRKFLEDQKVPSAALWATLHAVSSWQLEEPERDSLGLRLGTLGRQMAPAEALLSVHTLWICGECHLQRYGAVGDGGYLMCDLADFEAPLAIYSYGIDGEDSWGHAVSAASGALLHQYDCFNQLAPAFAAGMSASDSAFHPACLSAVPGFHDGRRFQTLSQHLLENGHSEAPVASLLLKVDIEGREWEVFEALDPVVLAKFKQLVIEFHDPLLTHLLAIDELKMKALSNLLQHFVVVHVHANNFCIIPGLGGCLEVTFANRAIVEPSSCRKLRSSLLDAANFPDIPNVVVESLF
eukprot:TRINITY_DN83469_c0_g1_i1.p1 TRINITY_DN83469_c0_g1~~TRINITY_DN83469_c0_g1_i1.p1  ORF type:complete len:409 (-),score=74.21 TRINITY_DN83469_c0_g1_i1:21-1133(-)